MVDSWRAKLSPRFEVRGGVLYWVEDQEDREERCQILVPRRYWGVLLWVTHMLPMGGHLGWDKTEVRLKWRVFWPGLYKMMEKSCVECAECQRMGGVRLAKVPLMPMPHSRAPL